MNAALMDIEGFLRESVYYPCCGYDGTPVRFLGKRFQRYLYVDYSIDPTGLQERLQAQGFKGYAIADAADIDINDLTGRSWASLAREFQKYVPEHFSKMKRTDQPCALHVQFSRMPDYGPNHGPDTFEVMFVRSEGVTTYRTVFLRRGIAPKCLVHIRPGTAFGGNYSGYPCELERAVRENSAGLPDFILYESALSNTRSGDYMPIIRRYTPMRRWRYRPEEYGTGHVTLAGLGQGQTA
jgi:hypothetical protein